MKAAADDEIRNVCIPVIIGSAPWLAGIARHLRLPCGYEILLAPDELARQPDGPLIYNLNNIDRPLDLGVASALGGRASAEYIETAARLCLSHHLDALVSAPISKQALMLADYSYPGHTEFLAHLTGATDYAIAFIASSLRVVLLTNHVPLAEAIAQVSKGRIERMARLTHRELKRWGIERPRIAVAALNPHGSEGGLFGIEEASELIPAIESLNQDPEMDVRGPFSAHAVFLRALRGEFDAVLSCYHDQAAIAIKCLSFGEAVNATLGLPFIRTSPDHGTAYDIAGKGVADPSSLIAAIHLAVHLYERQQAASVS